MPHLRGVMTCDGRHCLSDHKELGQARVGPPVRVTDASGPHKARGHPWACRLSPCLPWSPSRGHNTSPPVCAWLRASVGLCVASLGVTAVPCARLGLRSPRHCRSMESGTDRAKRPP